MYYMYYRGISVVVDVFVFLILFIFICMYLFFQQSDRHKLYISSLMLVDSGGVHCRIMRYTLLIKSVDEFRHYCIMYVPLVSYD